MPMSLFVRASSLAVAALVISGTAYLWLPGENQAPLPAGAAVASPDIHKIQHVVIIMQENRSFDNYFGTYPGADGLPRAVLEGKQDCNRDLRTGQCLLPYHDTRQVD